MGKILISLVAAVLFFGGCSTKNSEELFNKPAVFWYEKIIDSIKRGDLEKADDYFTSLSSEHIASPLLKESLLILAQAHSDEEEYILANFYLDEYLKRYGDKKSSEYIKYLKVKVNFDSFKQPKRDQQLLHDTIKEAEAFIKKYPKSRYEPLVQTILTKMYLADYYLNQSIIELYKKQDKPQAAAAYEEKNKNSWLHSTQMIEPNISWYRSLFE